MGSGISSSVSLQAIAEHHALVARSRQVQLVHLLAAGPHFQRLAHPGVDIGRLLLDGNYA